MHNLGSHPQPLPTKLATAAVETNRLTDAESCATQLAEVTIRTSLTLEQTNLSLLFSQGHTSRIQTLFSEDAYAAVEYLRIVDAKGDVHISLVISKTKVSPIKRLSIPRLELCRAFLLSQLLDHTRKVFCMLLSEVNAWTDSTIVLSWLSGIPRKYKTYVGNRVAQIVDLIPPE